jgi:hypothetical protein
MKKLKFLSLMFAACLAFTSCDQNGDGNGPSGPDDFSEHFGNAIQGDFMGRIVNPDNEPISGVSVAIGPATAQTDANGVFIIRDAEVKERFAYIKATKNGYFDGSRSLVPASGMNNVTIMMIPAVLTETIQAGSEAEVTLENQSSITFDGAFEDESGNSYSGSVNVYAYHLEASNDDLERLMPGMLYAADGNNNERVLETFGMLNVELRGAGGQKLQVADGHTAEISMKIDASQMGSSPATIPLWHFDADRGYWKEGGEATKQGGFYVGEVSHFSWWNCDAQFPTVHLNAHIEYGNGEPAANVLVEITRSGGWTTSGWTSSTGDVSGLIPANEVVTIKAYNPICGEVMYTAQIGPFATDTTLPDITIGNTVQTTIVQGNLVDCNANAVTNGYVVLNNESYAATAVVTSGAFEFSIPICDGSANVTLEGYDFENVQTTDSIQYTVAMPVTNVGNLVACTAIDEFISYQIDNQPTVYLIGQLESGTDGPDYMWVSGYNEDEGGLNVSGNTQTPGIYNTDIFSIEGNQVYIHDGMTNDVVFTLTQFGPPGDWIDMTFNGTYNTPDNVTHTITGVVHVQRDN